MSILGQCLLVQLSLTFGVAGLLWPDKFMPLFELLMFPWAASARMIRVHGMAAVGLSVILLITLISGVA
jgi:hypothetical protein